jgi:hypothetical protein
MLCNATGFAASAVPFLDERGVEVVVLLAKATFVKRNRELVLADEQVPIRMNDVPIDLSAVQDERESSIRYPSDVCGEKPGADIVVVGSAISRKPVTSIDVAVRAPGRTVSLRVYGERVYYKSALGIRVAPGHSFERAAITYERAYGGRSKDGSVVDWRNPVGRGVHDSVSELDLAPAPCIEDPLHPVDDAREHVPVGFGAIAMWWLPRRDFTGTMDARWQVERMPLPAFDFDRRFYQVAHPSLQLERPLHGGDMLATHGMSLDDLFDVTIPSIPIVAHLHRNRAPKVSLPMILDTALLEPEWARVEFTFRRVVPLGRGDTLLREVRIDVDT